MTRSSSKVAAAVESSVLTDNCFSKNRHIVYSWTIWPFGVRCSYALPLQVGAPATHWVPKPTRNTSGLQGRPCPTRPELKSLLATKASHVFGSTKRYAS